jgi:chromosomal replication initiation ATPase DnaA
VRRKNFIPIEETQERPAGRFIQRISKHTKMIPSFYVYPGFEPTAGVHKIIKSRRQMSITDVVSMVCEYYEISEKQMYSRFRGNRPISDARKIICYLAHTFLKRQFVDIARIINRDHTTVMYAVNSTTDLMENNEQFAKDVYHLTSKVIK